MTDREAEFQKSWETLTTAFGLAPDQKREIYAFTRCMFTDGWIAGQTKKLDEPKQGRNSDICSSWPRCACDLFADCKDGYSFREKYGLRGKYKIGHGFGGGKYRLGERPR